MNYQKEYDFLRKEMDENKKYILERPFIAITLGFASIGLLENSYIPFIPPIILFLLYYNLWFTINRLDSSARIIAYIQIFIEQNRAFFGWENLLREYRRFKKINSKEKLDKLLNEKMDKEAVPDGMRFYPQIRNFHIILVSFCIATSIFLLFEEGFNFPQIFGLSISGVVGIFFLILNIRNNMGKLNGNTERERVFIEFLAERLNNSQGGRADLELVEEEEE